MNISTREYSKYINIDVEVAGVEADLGFHDVAQAVELMHHLQDVIENLRCFIEDKSE